MCRVTLHLDETRPERPAPVLRVNGLELTLSEHELAQLFDEVVWARAQLSEASKKRFANLAEKYHV